MKSELLDVQNLDQILVERDSYYFTGNNYDNEYIYLNMAKAIVLETDDRHNLYNLAGDSVNKLYATPTNIYCFRDQNDIQRWYVAGSEVISQNFLFEVETVSIRSYNSHQWIYKTGLKPYSISKRERIANEEKLKRYEYLTTKLFEIISNDSLTSASKAYEIDQIRLAFQNENLPFKMNWNAIIAAQSNSVSSMYEEDESYEESYYEEDESW